MTDYAYTNAEVREWLGKQTWPFLKGSVDNPIAIPYIFIYAKVLELDRKARSVDGDDYFRNGTSDVSEDYRIAYDILVRNVEAHIYAEFPHFLAYLESYCDNFYDIVGDSGNAFPHEMWADNSWKDWVKSSIEQDYKELNRQPDECLSDLQKKQLGDLAYLVAEYCCD